MIQDFNIIRDSGLKIRDSKLTLTFYFLFSVFSFLSAAGCSSPPTDLRNFAPADALIYLETKDLGKTLDALTNNRAFAEAAKAKPDFSLLKNVQAAIVVSGFETSENQVTEENSVLNFKPHFALIAETHLWNWQTLRLVENNLNDFIRRSYGEDAKLETSEKNAGKSFVWTAKNDRKIYAFVENSRVYFGNDETIIEKCLAVSRGTGESSAKSGRGNFSAAENTLADGFISTAGIREIANIVGVRTAMQTTEDGAGRSFIARFLPTLLQNSVQEIDWTATQTEQGIEDKISIATAPEVAKIFNETLAANTSAQTNAAEFLSPDVYSATRYNLQNPLIAWRSLLLVAAKQTDAASGKIVQTFAGTLLAPYEITDAETFLDAVDAPILTAQFDADGEKSVVIANVKNVENLKKSIAGIDFKVQPEKISNAEIWKSEDGETSAAFVENKLILGSSDAVAKCLQAKQTGANLAKNSARQNFIESRAASATFGKDSAESVVEVLGGKKQENLQLNVGFFTETRFTEKGIERRTVSPFGLIGSLIEQIQE